MLDGFALGPGKETVCSIKIPYYCTMTYKKPTNTLLVGLKPEDVNDDSFFQRLTLKVEDLIKSETVEFIKLPSLLRVIIIFKTHESSITVYKLLRQDNLKVAYSVVDTKIPESTFLQLPDPGKKYVISPPPSPPADWVDKPEDGPNLKIIHNPQELNDLLFKRLGDRIERYLSSDSEDESKTSQGATNYSDNDSIKDEDFINEAGQLEVPKVLVERLNGNPIIVLDPPTNADRVNSDGRNAEGLSVNRIKTPRPPIEE